MSPISLRLIAALIVAGAVAGLWFYVDGLRSENEELKASKMSLEMRLKDQNDAIDNLKKEADERAAAAQLALEAARKETIAARKRAQDISRAKPSTPDDLCKSALDLINGAAR